MNLKEIIARLRDHPDNELALVWVGNNYSKLDLIHDLEALAEEKPYQANVCTECPDARKRKMIDDLFADTTTDEEKETAWEELKNIMKNSQFVPPPPSTGSCHQ